MGTPDNGQVAMPPAHYIATLEQTIRVQALSLARMEAMLAFVQNEREECRQELADFRLSTTVDEDPDAFTPFPDDPPGPDHKPRPPMGTPTDA